MPCQDFSKRLGPIPGPLKFTLTAGGLLVGFLFLGGSAFNNHERWSQGKAKVKAHLVAESLFPGLLTYIVSVGEGSHRSH